MAATMSNKGRRKSLLSRTIERCRSGMMSPGRESSATVAGCFSVYVGPERERFVVRAERANHPLFQRLLDDAENEYGYAAQGPLALPCGIDVFLDVLWHMEHDDDGGSEAPCRSGNKSPVCGLQGGGGRKRGAAGYRVLSHAKTAPASFFYTPTSPLFNGKR